ncbi:MAG: division/cell wall cluster transcriptional repressor MraZ, partial [Alphaproteobacteria bacterium]
MSVFVGTHINKIDRKGRVSVPASFRAAFGTVLAGGAYVMRSI